MEFFDDSLREFAAFAALAGNPKLRSQIGHITGTTAAKIANLVISNLSTNAHVHGVSSIWRLL